VDEVSATVEDLESDISTLTFCYGVTYILNLLITFLTCVRC